MTGPRQNPGDQKRAYVFGYSGPAILAMILLIGAPLSYALWSSFFSYSFTTDAVTFVGFDNYRELFNDETLLRSLSATLWIVLPAITLQMTLGLAFALALNSLMGRGAVILTTIFTIPIMISGAAVGMAYRMMFTPEWGPIDQFAQMLNGGRSIDWLGDPFLARLSIITADVWQNTPFVILITLAALSAIPKEIHEAARMDGAGPVERFLRIDFPLIRKFLLVALLFRLIDLFRIFDVVYVMTSGGPASATETISYYVYRTGILFFDVGYAAVMGLAMAFVMLMLSRALIGMLRQRRTF
jgi:multiple sugar transport system permease protein